MRPVILFHWSLIFINNHLATVIFLVIITINNNATGHKFNQVSVVIVLSAKHFKVPFGQFNRSLGRRGHHHRRHRCSRLLSLAKSLFYLPLLI